MNLESIFSFPFIQLAGTPWNRGICVGGAPRAANQLCQHSQERSRPCQFLKNASLSSLVITAIPANPSSPPLARSWAEAQAGKWHCKSKRTRVTLSEHTKKMPCMGHAYTILVPGRKTVEPRISDQPVEWNQRVHGQKEALFQKWGTEGLRVTPDINLCSEHACVHENTHEHTWTPMQTNTTHM